ncbi:MAG TPA: hypothetical protein VG842_03070, partial [Sediminibacterium sp.]|nr:hypothetical protein [Sediminibacterium sp.]
MLLHLFHQLSVYSVFFPVFVGLARYRSIPPGYRPFLLFVLLALAGDLGGQLLIHYYHNNIAFGNFYTLAEFLVLLLFFHQWSLPENRPGELCILCLGIAIWVLDNLIWHRPGHQNAIFRVAYSLILTWKSAILLARLVVQKNQAYWKDPLILSLFAFLLYFSFKAFIQV